MIVVDSSALCAVFFGEPGKDACQALLDETDRCLLSAVNAHETAIVLNGKLGEQAAAQFWEWLADNGIEVVAFDELQARTAAEAFSRFGKGIHARARLNLADCAAYALAKTMKARLLFKGEDFAATDIDPAV